MNEETYKLSQEAIEKAVNESSEEAVIEFLKAYANNY